MAMSSRKSRPCCEKCKKAVRASAILKQNAGQGSFGSRVATTHQEIFGDPEKRDRLLLSIAPRLD